MQIDPAWQRYESCGRRLCAGGCEKPPPGGLSVEGGGAAGVWFRSDFLLLTEWGDLLW